MTLTAVPAPYAGMCEYNKCVMVDGNVPCTPGSTGCSCMFGTPSGIRCIKKVETEVCTPTDVDPWSDIVDYVTDDVVCLGTQKFGCR